jgi:hypothetical protein
VDSFVISTRVENENECRYYSEFRLYQTARFLLATAYELGKVAVEAQHATKRL